MPKSIDARQFTECAIPQLEAETLAAQATAALRRPQVEAWREISQNVLRPEHPFALHVSLFQPEAVAALGTVVPARIDPTAAMAQGLSASGFEHVVYRQVLGRVLSLVYFPLWVVELTQGTDRWLTVVDAAAESVVQPRAPLTLADALGQGPGGAPQIVGLRPLVCPNCGHALDYRRSQIGGVSARNSEQWDYFDCAMGCGTFEYRQRTRKLRRVP